MAKIKVQTTSIEGLVVLEPTVFGDDRGYFLESYNVSDFQEVGIDANFVQDNESKSKRGVLRGLHFQTNNPQGKLIRVIEGEVFDVAVDLRKDSSTYGQWEGVYLSGENKKLFYIPPCFAHGFLVLSDSAIFSYKCTEIYDPLSDSGIAYNDPELAIRWPLDQVETLLLSDKDKQLKSLSEVKIAFDSKLYNGDRRL